MNVLLFVAGAVFMFGSGTVVGREFSEHKTIGAFSGSVVKRDFNRRQLVKGALLFGIGAILIAVA